ncbi:pseudouridine synthase [Trametopsis cervina]|nr:pseudouridine synthase [Trametopsis cervina]
MEATNSIPQKRPLEDAEPSEPAPSRLRTPATEVIMDTREDAGPSTKPATGDDPDKPVRKGKGKKTSMSRREAREAHKTHDTRRGTRPERAEGEGDIVGEGDGEKGFRLPKRQCALMLGFCGSDYSGMQFQPHARTIEGALFEALIRAGAVSQDNADSIAKVNFSRAARTDAGVHAAGNLVSMKMITCVPGVPDLVARINEELPPEIRLWGFERVLKSFNARNTCDSRKYTYYFPSYLLIPPKPGSGQDKVISQHTDESPENPLRQFWSGTSTETTKEEDLERKRQFRVPTQAVELLRNIAKKFEGSHNFHNFTVGRDYNDRSSMRMMRKIEIADPVVHGPTEWIAVMFHGQSFMLHQVRKMMTALVLCCRTNTPPEIMDELYGPRNVFVPKMPALGLLLEYPIFDNYNKRVTEKVDPSDPDYRRPVDFESYREKIDAFKQEHIYSRMRAIEDQGGVFDAWIRSLDKYNGNDLLYFNPEGKIPEAAVIKRTEKRSAPFREKKRFDVTTFPSGADVAKLMAEEEVRDADEDTEEKLGKKELLEMEG